MYLVEVTRVSYCNILVEMEPSDHMSLKNSTAILWLLDLIIFGVIVALFFEEHMKNNVMFFTIIFACISFSIKLVYFFQCLQESTRNDPSWNHTVEMFPVAYCFITQIVIIIITIISLLKALDLSLIQAFAKLDIETLYLIIALWFCYPIVVIVTLRMFSIHRAYSCH